MKPKPPTRQTPTPRLSRCPAVSPGGITRDGELPAKGTQCGLEMGHAGEHCVIIPTGYPWSTLSGQRQRTTD